MIDNPTEVAKLIEKMEAALPILVHPTGNLSRSLKKSHNIIIKPTQIMKIEQIHYMGDGGGISCSLTSAFKMQKSIVASLTHLRVAPTHLLYKEIHAYQLRRTKNLAAQNKASTTIIG
jgi:hypothetical protein